MPHTGVDVFLDLLADAGVRHLFGNPGTTELPLYDALLGDRRFEFILGLQEVPVVAMADGYAMASRQIGVINLHTCCGLGNAMGMLYNAWREGTPLLLTAGQQDRRLMFDEPILAGNMVGVTQPWTKWAYEVQSIDQLPSVLRRAIQTALTPPTGPVFLSLPLDIQMAVSGTQDLAPLALPDQQIRPPVAALGQAADVLLGADNPAILAGSRVTEADAVEELATLAEMLGACVFSEPGTTHGRLAFPSSHPLNAQGLPLWAKDIRSCLTEFDVLMVAGMDLFREYIYDGPTPAIPATTRLIHLDEDPWQLGKNFPLHVGLIGNTKAGLAELVQQLRKGMNDAHRKRAKQRNAFYARRHATERQTLQQKISAEKDHRPMTTATFMNALARVLPSDVAVVEEAVTTTGTLLERLGSLQNTSGYFGHRGWALGWGLGCAIGTKLAWPDRPVLAILGEGAAMYGIQGLWSAAHHKIPVTFVIPNNAQYQILKLCSEKLKLPRATGHQFVGMDLVEPEVDLVTLAQSMGVAACRVTDPDVLSDTVEESFKKNEPRLIDVPIVRTKPDRLAYG